MIPKFHRFIEYKVENFINNADYCIKPAIKKILDNTIYISFELFMTYLIKNFKNFINNDELFIYIPNEFMNKSNYWIYQLMNYYKDKINFKGKLIIINDFNNEKLKDNSKILIPDDCIYSGEQLRLIIEYLNNPKKLNLDIYLFISFMTYEGLNKITNEFNMNSKLTNCNLHLMKNIYYISSNINNYLKYNEIKLLENYYSITIKNQYLIYFDHKMPDDYSSLPLIYSGIVANFNNKVLLNLYKKERKKEIINQINYIQFINKTENIRNISKLEPDIIKPPYK